MDDSVELVSRYIAGRRPRDVGSSEMRMEEDYVQEEEEFASEEDEDDEDEDYGVDDDDEEEDIGEGSSTHAQGRKFRSKAWREFEPIRVDGEVAKGECKHCKAVISVRRGHVTSGLRNHLNRCKDKVSLVGALHQMNASCMDGLPEEVIHEVLSRVGNVKDLFVLAVTCRRWLRRFTDPAFLRGLWAAGHRARLLGFFFKQTRLLSFLPTPGSPLRTLSSSLDDGTFNYAEPLAARHGIVLMQLAPCRLGLCNPITGERHVLPPLDCSGGDDLYAYAIITAADSDLDRTASTASGFSQLLVTNRTNGYKVCLQSYSAATRSWSAPTICQDNLNHFFQVGERSAVVHRGAAHWLWINEADNLLYTLSTEVNKEKHPCDVLSMTKLPQVRVGGSPLLCVSTDGQLSVACVHPAHMTLWAQQQGHGEWLRTAVIRIPTAVPNTNRREKWFDFSRGSMLVLYRSGGVFVLDLDKKVMEKIMDDCLLPRFSHLLNETKSVAYEMDLVDFFLLRLGGLCLSRK